MLRPRLAPLLAATVLLSGCATSSGSTDAGGDSGGLRIVAAENFWGSIASQLGGTRVSVQSIITNPAQDPHSYEPSPGDARALATAQLAIVNGIGYDPWAPKLLSANPTAGRAVLTVGDLLRLKEGDNPHRWYDPANVETVVNAITADLKGADTRDAAYYERRRALFETVGLARYHALIASIRVHYGGTPVGASESIFALLAPSLGLRLVTPPGFMNAISEGTEVTARDTATTERQLDQREVKLWIYNSQNATPEIQRLDQLARARHIPITTITEALSPASATFEQWQVAQLEQIQQALHEATGR